MAIQPPSAAQVRPALQPSLPPADAGPRRFATIRTVLALIPLALVAYIGWRVIADRLGNREDDHYDRME